jgi:hypothetical protein
MWIVRVGNFLTSIPTDFPILFCLVKWLRDHTVFKVKIEEETESHDHEAAPPMEKLNLTCYQKHLAYNGGRHMLMQKERYSTDTEAGHKLR